MKDRGPEPTQRDTDTLSGTNPGCFGYVVHVKPCKEHSHAYKYGTTVLDGVKMAIHRAEWIKHHGPIPVGMRVCHHCDNPPCHEITHLFLGTAKDNFNDMREKHRDNLWGHKKLTREQVEEIRALPKDTNRAEVGRSLGVTRQTISRIMAGKLWV